MELNTGAKVWLWIIFVINIITLVVSIPTILTGITLLGPTYTLLSVISIVVSCVFVAGIAVLLFGHKKVGFYLMVVAAVASLILNIALGTNIVRAIISAVLCPLITYFVIKSQWDELA